MVARRVLPALGGAPFVWTTCVLFFQGVLVAGYALAYGVARLRHSLAQAIAFGVILAVGLASLPLPSEPAGLDGLARRSSPVLGLLALLTLWVGPSCLALSATAPLLQHWYGRGLRESSRDPYGLYAASNAGSLLALAAYPLWIERAFSASRQLQLWGVAVFGLAGLVALCVRVNGARWVEPPRILADAPRTRPTLRDWLAWMSLACVPSVLTLAVTSHLTTDLAAVPLLWVVPLGLYLLSMILAFAWR
ncbi:MAG: spermidine synthase, partial [Isosphaeraceae bacterium]